MVRLFPPKLDLSSLEGISTYFKGLLVGCQGSPRSKHHEWPVQTTGTTKNNSAQLSCELSPGAWPLCCMGSVIGFEGRSKTKYEQSWSGHWSGHWKSLDITAVFRDRTFCDAEVKIMGCKSANWMRLELWHVMADKKNRCISV